MHVGKMFQTNDLMGSAQKQHRDSFPPAKSIFAMIAVPRTTDCLAKNVTQEKGGGFAGTHGRGGFFSSLSFAES